MTPPPAKLADPVLDAATLTAAPARSGARTRLLRAVSMLPALAFLLLVLAPPLNHDVAAVLNFAERWLAGEQLYRDLIDVNPPLIFVLTAIPAAIGNWTPLDGPESLQLCTLLLCLGIWRMTVALRAGTGEGPIEGAVLAAVVPLVMLMAGYDFAQREHLMAMVTIPYAMLAARRVEGRPTGRGLAFGVTLLAALGFALKPHFMAVPALIEAYLLVRRGPRRALVDPLPWFMAGIWVLYLASIPLLFPDYFGHVVPLVWSFYLDLSAFSMAAVLFSHILLPAVLVLVAGLAIAFRPWGAKLPTLLILAATGACISAWVQHKGWSYHALPIHMLGTLAIIVAIAHWLDGAITPVRRPRAAPAIAAVLAAALAIFMSRGESPWRQIWYTAEGGARLADLLRREAYGERLLVLSPAIYPIYPSLNYARAQSTLRTMNLWLLQGTNQECLSNGERYRQTWEMSRAEFFVYRTVAEDFAAAPPSAVLVGNDAGIPVCHGQRFDLVAYFSRHPLFAEAWQHYRLGVEMDGYRLYVRED